MIDTALNDFPATARIFLPAGRVLGVGDTLVQRDLAETLRRIQREGRDGFYAGGTADLLAAEMRRGGGLITREDLAAYRPAWREPVRFTYRGDTVLSMPPSSSGGVTLAMIAGILEGYDLGKLRGTPRATSTSWRRRSAARYADRNTRARRPGLRHDAARAADRPGVQPRERRATIRSNAPPSRSVGREPAGGDPHTTHFSVVDRQGNTVAVTTTMNSFYGIRAVVEGGGLPAEQRDGRLLSEAGGAEPVRPRAGRGERHRARQAPALGDDADHRARSRGETPLVLGSPGGSTIITNVLQNLSNVLDFGMGVAQAVSAPRIHHQGVPADLITYDGDFPAATIDALRQRGYRVEPHDWPLGDVQMIVRTPDGWDAASDPRGRGEVRRLPQ